MKTSVAALKSSATIRGAKAIFATRVINRIAPPTIAKNAIHSRTRRQSMLLLQRVIDALGVVHRLLLHGGFEAPRALERVARSHFGRRHVV